MDKVISGFGDIIRSLSACRPSKHERHNHRASFLPQRSTRTNEKHRGVDAAHDEPVSALRSGYLTGGGLGAVTGAASTIDAPLAAAAPSRQWCR